MRQPFLHPARGRVPLRITCMVLLTCGCTSSTAPDSAIVMSVSATPVVVAVGDTIRLVGSAFNPGTAAVRAGDGCSPGIAFIVSEPLGGSMVLGGGGGTCLLKDSNSIDPGETDSVGYLWSPGERGTYVVQAALVHPHGMGRSSSGTVVTVR